MRHSIIIEYDKEAYRDTDGKNLGKAIKLMQEIKEDNTCRLSKIELMNLYCLINSIKKLKGDVVEVGVHKGGSAKLIKEYLGNKKLYLFDTFEGLPETTKEDSQVFEKGDFEDTNLDKVVKYIGVCSEISGLPDRNIIFHEGMFQDTCNLIKDNKFSFIHLDVDLYDSTLFCLDFFYSRMESGAILITHNYTDLLGVRKAMDEFLKDKPECLIKFPIGTQAMFIKR